MTGEGDPRIINLNKVMEESERDEALNRLSKEMKETADKYEAECEEYWNNLSEEDRLKAFYSVCKRIHKGDIVDKGSYRYVIYDVFGFGYEAYSIGMECGYMDIHNSIWIDENDVTPD